MKNILDPLGLWFGKPPLALSIGNKRPVAVDDTLSVAMDSAPVTVDVLINDVDPEGQPLSLISASAALGTTVAEADNTVSYTPPAGVSGFDTVVYTIADDLGQQTTGQINVTIVEPQLSILTTPENTLVVDAQTGQIDITITDPPEFAGTYQTDTVALSGGPINLAVPGITGTVATGQTLTAVPGLWIHDVAAGPLAQSWLWYRGGAEISGATQDSYVLQAGDIGPGISVLEVLGDTSGQRLAESVAVGATFQPPDDASLIGWWDADDAATLTQSNGLVSNWADKGGSTPITQVYGPERPATGVRSLNGRNVLEFDGSKLMECSLAVPASGDIAFHLALIIDSTSSAFAAALAVEATNDFQIDANDGAAFNGRLNAAGIGSPVNLTGGPFSGALILSAVFDRTGAATAEVYVANALRAQTGYTTAIDPTVVMTLMTNRSQNANIDGAIAELIVTGDVSNRALHHAYLADKWGLS